jgi:putative SOS response-associated peptidase YedK
MSGDIRNVRILATLEMSAVRSTDEGPELVLLKWGLIPPWATDPAIGYKLINARAETVAEKPSFRSAFKQRRCLIPASGFSTNGIPDSQLWL